MKIHHLISVASVCIALFGCATQPPAKDTPSATLNPEDMPVVAPASINAGDMLPKVIRAANAVYPIEAKIRRITGVVTVAFVVDKNGKVVSPTVIESPDPILSEATVDAISQWEFLPGERNGKKVNVRMKMSFTFALDN